MTKRLWFSMTALLMTGALLLTACGSKPAPQTPAAPSQTQQPAPPKPVTITWIHWRGEDKEVLEKLAAKFKQETNITVEMAISPSTNYLAAVSGAILSGDSGDVIAMFPGGDFTNLAKQGAYADLGGEKFLANFNEQYLSAGKFGGKQLGVPYQLVHPGPLYNTEAFDKAGIKEAPKTFTELVDACTKLKSAGFIPFAYMGATSNHHFFNFLVTNNAANEDVLTNVESKKQKFTEPWFVDTLKQLKTLVDNGCFQEGAAGADPAPTRALVAQGKAAVLLTGSWDFGTLPQLNPNIKLGQMLPVAAGTRAWDGIHSATFVLSVNAKSKNQEAAKKWIEFLTSPDNASEYANATGQGLTVKGVTYKSDTFKYLANLYGGKKTRQQPMFMTTMADTQVAIRNAMAAVVSKQLTPEAAAEAAQKELESKLK